MKLQNIQAGRTLATRKQSNKQNSTASSQPQKQTKQASQRHQGRAQLRSQDELHEHLGRRTSFTDQRRFRGPPSRGRAKDAAIVGREEITSLVCESVPLRSPQKALEPLLGGEVERGSGVEDDRTKVPGGP